MDWRLELAVGIVGPIVLIGGIAIVASLIYLRMRKRSLAGMLKSHFRSLPIHQISVTERLFPVQVRVDLQRATEEFIADSTVRMFITVRNPHGIGGVDFASLFDEQFLDMMSAGAGPPQYEQIDIGEEEPVQALQSGLWLLEKAGLAMQCFMRRSPPTPTAALPNACDCKSPPAVTKLGRKSP